MKPAPNKLSQNAALLFTFMDSARTDVVKLMHYYL
jgi:hypothetical protein